MATMFESAFKESLSAYASSQTRVDLAWQEIKDAYSDNGRYYHVLNHLENIFSGLTQVRHLINDWDAVIFSIAYHDFVYDTGAHDNEERSANIAVKTLERSGVTENIIDKCREMILATKTHSERTDEDINLFTDADLAILGADPEVYMKYAGAIRKEFKEYPDKVYREGRGRVLKLFLSTDRIYKTSWFYGLYERQARFNMENELENFNRKTR